MIPRMQGRKSHAYSCGPEPQVLAEEDRRRHDIKEEGVEVDSRASESSRKRAWIPTSS